MTNNAVETVYSSPVKTGHGFSAFPCDDLNCFWNIIPAPQELILEEGEFVIESRLGSRRICKLTGRTRRLRADWRALTVQTFDVETVVRCLPDGTPSLWGVRGEAFSGTFAIGTGALA
jgi:hypothetical protein